jgi:CheY-like chemotaxis protein
MPALVTAVVAALLLGFLVYDGHEPIVLGAVAVLGAVGVGMSLWARASAAAEANRLRAAGVTRDSRMSGVQAEADRLRGELTRAVSQQREAEEATRTAATAAAERQKQQETALREAKAEADRLRKDLETARRQLQTAAAAPAAAPAARAVEPAVPAPAPPRPAAPAAPPRPAPAPPAAPPPRPAAPAPAAAPPRPAPPPPAPASEPAVAAAPAPPTGKREPDPAPGDAVGTVLLVDDDASFLFVAANILRPAGYRVIEAESGQSALDKAGQEAKIDLLVTDMMMPGMNGRQLAQRFTKLRPGVRVLYVSGFVDEGSAREAIEGEEADFLAKPFEADAFIAKVRELARAAR